MTQEGKELLFKDLSARLPYGIMVDVRGGEFDSYKYPYQLTAISKFGLDSFCKVYHPIYIPFGVPNVENVKPYLCPLSSMTEEEKEELLQIINDETSDIIEQLKNNNCGIMEGKYHFNSLKEFDWLNAHHFDYRGLIERGLALAAPDGMYKRNG